MNTDIFLQRVNIIRPDLERLARNKIRVQTHVEDIIQETLMRLWIVREKWEKHQNCKPMAINILENCIISHQRKIREVEPLENQPFADYAENPHQIAEAKDFGRFIWKLMEQLPPLQHLIMRLKDIEGLEVEEIAKITNLSSIAIRTNLCRARNKIRNEMS